MTTRDKFLKLVSDNFKKREIEYNRKNRAMLSMSQKIALKVLNRMDELNWDKETLANEMNVSIALIDYIVTGKNDLTLSIIAKIEETLQIRILTD